MTLTHGALFNGIAGFPLAAAWAGIETTWTCEIDPFCNAVSKKHFPKAKQYNDIKDLKNPKYVDIISGGFPCQPFSQAGKQKGSADDRHLWPEMFRVIAEVRPRWVIAENVTGIIKMELGQVLSDLESIGYDFPRDIHGLPVVPVIPAAGINAPHKRDRVWIISHSNRVGRERCGSQESEWQQNDRWKGIWSIIEGFSRSGIIADTSNINSSISIQQRGQNPTENFDLDRENESGYAPDTNIIGSHRSINTQKWRSGFEDGSITNGAISDTIRKRGRKNNGIGKSEQFNKDSSRIDWRNFPTQSPICARNDGVPSGLVRFTDGSLSRFKEGKLVTFQRTSSIKAGGNAIVPQIPYEIFKAIKEIENYQIA